MFRLLLGLTVTTPQAVSIDDSRRSLDMFKKLDIPIAGIVENMSGFIAPDTGVEYDIFGKGTSSPMARMSLILRLLQRFQSSQASELVEMKVNQLLLLILLLSLLSVTQQQLSLFGLLLSC